VDRTLEFSETVMGDEGEVTATFEHFPDQQNDPSTIVWTLRRIDGEWKVADIASPGRGWRLSAFDCD
jgi:stress response protein SCP2